MGTFRNPNPVFPVLASFGLLAGACTVEQAPPPVAIGETPVETVTGTEAPPAPASPEAVAEAGAPALGATSTPENADDAPVPVPLDPAAYEAVRLGPPIRFADAGTATVLPGHFAPGAPALALPVATGSLVSAREHLGAECPGYVPAEPAVRLTIDEPTRAVITAPAGPGGSVLLLRSRAGFRCEVAGPGESIRIEPLLIRGDLEIWSGTLEPGATLQGNLEITQGPPSFDQADCDASRVIRLRPGAEPVEVAGTNTASRGCESAFNSPYCGGYFDTEPGPCLLVEEPTWIRVEARAADFAPVAAVLRGDSPSHRNSVDTDGSQSDAYVMLPLRAGLHTLHVGSSTLGRGGAWTAVVSATAEPEDVAQLPADGCVAVAAGAAPLRVAHTHGDTAPCEQTLASGECVGTIETGSGLCLRVSEPTTVNLAVAEAEFDTTLTLSGADTQLFADHGGEYYNAGLTATLQPGEYRLRAGVVGTPGAPAIRILVDPR